MVAATRAATAQEQLAAMTASERYGPETTSTIAAALSQPVQAQNVIGPLGQRITFNWVGGLVPAVQALASSAGFQVKQVGQPGPVPVLVTINKSQTQIYDLLQECGEQAGSRAGVVIYPDQNLVEIVWGANG
jgi:hypothetical protein